MPDKQFGVGLRIMIEESADKEITKSDVKNIIDDALNSESKDDAELVISGEIDGVKRLKN